MEPQIRKRYDALQLSYNLPFRPLASSLYPLPAPDGASIVVCGHSSGLSIFKIYPAAHMSQTLSTADEGIESTSTESTPSASKTILWLEIEVGSPVQHIAFPPVSPSSRNPNYLQSHLVLAVGCANSSISVVSFGLDEKRDKSKIHITKVNSTASHQDLISSLAVTWTVDSKDVAAERSRPQNPNVGEEQNTSLLLASVSTTGNGLLTVHKISLSKHAENQKNASRLIIRDFLRLPLLASTISFSNAVYPSTRHSLLLVSSYAYGIVKVFNTIAAASSRKRKLSEISLNHEDSGGLSRLENCLTLSAGFSSAEKLPRRKLLLDAKWCSQGRSIIGLIEGGEWGLWDLESMDNPVTAAGGGRLSVKSPGTFILHGVLSSAMTKRKITHSKPAAPLAPMTPHTRKSRSANLFGEANPSSGSKQLHPLASSGYISVCPQQTSNASNDDAIVLSNNHINDFIPSLMSQRRSNATGSGGVVKSSKLTLQALPPVQLAGEHQLSVHMLPSTSPGAGIGLLAGRNHSPDLLIVTDSRLIIHTQSLLKNQSDSTSLILPLRRAERNKNASVSQLGDDRMLSLDAMDKMLDSMEDDGMEYASPKVATSTTMKPSSNSALAHEFSDISPTAAKSAKSKLVIDKSQQVLFR